jgi:hypothetical protein
VDRVGASCILSLPSILSTRCPPTDADGPLCGIPAPQGISSLTSGNWNKGSGLCPCATRPAAVLTPGGLPLSPQLCPGHVGSWLGFSAPSCAPALLASGCDSGGSCDRGCLAVTLESTSATQARTVRPGPTPHHPPIQSRMPPTQPD